MFDETLAAQVAAAEGAGAGDEESEGGSGEVKGEDREEME